MCAVHCVQLLHTILHRTDLIIFPLALQTITIAPMMSIWGKGGNTKYTHWQSTKILQQKTSVATTAIPEVGRYDNAHMSSVHTKYSSSNYFWFWRRWNEITRSPDTRHRYVYEYNYWTTHSSRQRHWAMAQSVASPAWVRHPAARRTHWTFD